MVLGSYQNMVRNYGEECAATIFYLKTCIQIYPIVAASGYKLSAPLAVVVDDEQVIPIISREVCGFAEPMVFPLNAKKADYANCVEAAEYGFLGFQYRGKHYRNRENLLGLGDMMISGKMGLKKFSGLPLVFLVGGIPSEIADLFCGKVVIESRNVTIAMKSDMEDFKGFLQTIIDNLPEIHEIIEKKKERFNRENSFFEVCEEICISLMKPKNVISGKEQQRIRIFGFYLDKMKDKWIIEVDYQEWIDRMRECLLDEGKEIKFTQDRNLQCKMNLSDIDNSLFYDGKFYYITERMFDKACSHCSYYVSKTEIKNALCEEGILVGQGKNCSYFSVKLQVKTPDGIRMEKRRIRIAREWIDRPGELAWHEQINLRKKDTKDD